MIIYLKYNMIIYLKYNMIIVIVISQFYKLFNNFFHETLLKIYSYYSI